MTWTTNPILGDFSTLPPSGLVMSGCQTVVLRVPRYVTEHRVVALEGGVTEDLGRPVERVELHGFFYSGGDAEKTTLLSAIGTEQPLRIPSTISGRFWFDGRVLIDFIGFTVPPGHAYPYYDWHLGLLGVGMPASGAVHVAEPLSGIDYTQSLPLPAQVYIDYTQTLPMAAQAYVDYTQTLPLGAQGYGLNYVRIS